MYRIMYRISGLILEVERLNTIKDDNVGSLYPFPS